MATNLQIKNGAGATVYIKELGEGTVGDPNIPVVSLDQTTPGVTNGVVLAAALPAGTNAIGKLAANSGVDIGDVDIASIASGTNVIGKVGIDQTTPGTTNGVQVNAALPSGDNNIGNVDIATLPALPTGSNVIGAVKIDQTIPGTTNLVQLGGSLPAGTNAIGKLSANDGVDIGNVDVASLPALSAGDNNIGNVDIVSMPALSTGSNVIGKVAIDQTTPGTTNLVQIGGSLPAGSAAIGKLSANDGVDIGNVDVASISAGSNVIGKVGIDQTTPGTTNGVQLTASIPSGTNSIGKLGSNSGVVIGDVNVSTIAVGSNVIGKIGIDQTTPGTTNGVQVVAALPAGDNNVGNVDVVSLPALATGSNVIGSVSINQTTDGTTNRVYVAGAVTVSQTPTITAGAYTAKDAVGGLLTFANAVRISGGKAVINSVTIIDKSQQAAGLELWLFNQTFTATADNAAFDPSDADLANAVGVIPISSVDYYLATDNELATVRNAGLQYQLTGTSLYGQLKCTGTPTYESTSDLTIVLSIQYLD